MDFFDCLTFPLSDENINGPADSGPEAAADVFPTGFMCGASGLTLNDLKQRNEIFERKNSMSIAMTRNFFSFPLEVPSRLWWNGSSNSEFT